MPDPARILVVDDNPSNVKALRQRLLTDGHDVLEATSGQEALDLVAGQSPDLVLLDIMMPGMDGYEVCRRLKKADDSQFIPIIMVTALSEPDAVIRALDEGADEYVTKPFEPLELMARVRSMLRIRRMYQENTVLRQEIARNQMRFDRLIGDSQAMEKIYALLPRLAESEVTVLLSGESGTGKEAIARTIHSHGPRHVGRFVAVNCGALAEGVLESELFGHRKGAFTGASEDREGLFEAASQGTLFLDEIGETSPAMQTRLLRALQEGEITRVGESEPRQVNPRIIAATNRDLEAEVTAGNFREDLFYRLSVFPIRLPALRERRDDVPALANHFLRHHNEARDADARVQGFTPEALDTLARFDWPGNVRQLENEIERALVLTPPGGVIAIDALSERLVEGRSNLATRVGTRTGKLRDLVSQVECEAIRGTLSRCEGNRSRTAAELGITRTTLLQKLRQFGLDEG
ncbi:MAG: sigma-54-dependent Fis family transcriptional regulator [Gemmatimonadetes bacterium]|jgi:DNA-binding NtrC family response regulator|nr:sigma-54-dependent Fis family transcriptional regulator [Gemmatimonadota bacterium]